jgi:C4-dicarboxylate-specific signal transduction histidine kinase
MGELAASLSHEITQPIASSRNNARAAIRFLDRNPPDLVEVREALECLVNDADRAGKIIPQRAETTGEIWPDARHHARAAPSSRLVAGAGTNW